MDHLEFTPYNIESACKLYQLTNNSNERINIDNYINKFKLSYLPYNICYNILNSDDLFTKFIAITTIRDSIIREWNILKVEDIDQINNNIYNYINNNINILHSSIINQAMALFAIIYKRSWCPINVTNNSISDYNKAPVLINQITSMMQNENSYIFGLHLIRALLSEFNARLSSNLGVSWDFHTRCHRSFELLILPSLFNLLKPILSHELSLKNMREILYWEFDENITVNRMALTLLSNTYEPSIYIMPGPSWANSIDYNFVNLFFGLNSSIVDENSRKTWRKCCIQLACISGRIFNDSNKNQYVGSLLNGTATLISNFSDFDNENELFDIIELTKRVISNFKIEIISRVLENETNVSQYFNLLMNFTLTLIKLDSEFNETASEALDLLLEIWVTIINQQELYNRTLELHVISFLELACSNIFLSYTASKLNTINGILSNEDDDNFMDTVLQNQLQQISYIGRVSIIHSINYLVGEFSNSLNSNDPQKTYLILTLFAFLFADNAEGETACIPGKIMKYSLKNHDSIKLQFSFSQGAEDQILAKSIETDQILIAFEFIWRYFSVDNQQILTRPQSSLGMRLYIASILFLSRWCGSYLFLSESLYDSISPAFVHCFNDTSSPFVIKILDICLYRIEYVIAQVINLPSPLLDQLLEHICNLIEVLTKDSFVRSILLSHPSWQRIVEKLTETSILANEFVSESHLARLYLAICTFNGESADYAGGVFESRLSNLKNTILNSLQLLNNHDTNVCIVGLRQMSRILGAIKGITRSHGATIHLKFKFLAELFDPLIKLLLYCSNIAFKDEKELVIDVVYKIINLFYLIADMDLVDLYDDESMLFMSHCVTLIDSFGQYSRSSTETDSEENWCILLKLLDCVVLKDSIDNSREVAFYSANAVFSGIGTILPFLKKDGLLDYPNVLAAYFDIVSNLISIHTTRFLRLQPSDHSIVVESIEFGLRHAMPRVNISSLGCIFQLALCYLKSIPTNNTSKNNKPPFNLTPELTVLLMSELLKFQAMLLDSLTAERYADSVIDTLSDALLTLIACNIQHFSNLVSMKVQQIEHKEAGKGVLIGNAFDKLLSDNGVTMDAMERKNRLTFKKNLRNFLIEVKIALCIK